MPIIMLCIRRSGNILCARGNVPVLAEIHTRRRGLCDYCLTPAVSVARCIIRDLISGSGKHRVIIIPVYNTRTAGKYNSYRWDNPTAARLLSPEIDARNRKPRRRRGMENERKHYYYYHSIVATARSRVRLGVLYCCRSHIYIYIYIYITTHARRD